MGNIFILFTALLRTYKTETVRALPFRCVNFGLGLKISVSKFNLLLIDSSNEENVECQYHLKKV